MIRRDGAGRRRLVLRSLCGVVLVGAALLEPGSAAGLGAEDALWVDGDRPPRPAGRARAAGDPLDRHAARPGAWYALLQLPIVPTRPMELVVWPADGRHDIRLYAMDAPPDDEPSVVDRLPVRREAPRDDRPARLRARFALPPDSEASTVFVLVEQWGIDGDEPSAPWVQWLGDANARDGVRPWASAPDAAPGAAVAPDSPLARQERTGHVHIVPIFGGAWPRLPRR